MRSRLRSKSGKKKADAAPREPASSRPASPVDSVLQLQRTIGNQAVLRLYRSGALQAKLRVSRPGCPPRLIQRFKDPYHERMMESGLKATALEEKWREVYFGSWLRDFSQLLESGSDPAYKKAVVFVLNVMAEEKFGMGVDKSRLGVYSPAEHMDNPSTEPPATQAPILDAKNYIRSELKWAARLGRDAEGRIHFGQALHAVQDFFSHTNFVAGALDLCKDPKARPQPFVSGAFGQKDKEVSLLEMLVNFVRSKINWSQFSPTVGERVRQAVLKYLPFSAAEDRMPDMYFEDPRQHPENRSWFYVLDVLEPRLEQLRKEARSAVRVPTHSELHQDDPSRPFYSFAFALAERVTRDLAGIMDEAWTKEPDKNLDKMYKYIDEHLQAPEKTGWWKEVLAEKAALKCVGK